MEYSIEFKELLKKHIEPLRCKQHNTRPDLVFGANGNFRVTNVCCASFNKLLNDAADATAKELIKKRKDSMGRL